MKHPMQPIVLDTRGIARFKQNSIVRYLLDAGPFDMNHLSVLPFSGEDQEQFAQLVGYDVSGFGELDYVADESIKAADEAVDRLIRGND